MKTGFFPAPYTLRIAGAVGWIGGFEQENL